MFWENEEEEREEPVDDNHAVLEQIEEKTPMGKFEDALRQVRVAFEYFSMRSISVSEKF